jgi:hypothetical protein
MTDTPDLTPEAVERYHMDARAEFGQDAWPVWTPHSGGAWVRFQDHQDAVRALSAALATERARVADLERERDEWRNDFRALEKAIVGGTGLSAMTVAAQARQYRPRAEAAEAEVAHLRAMLEACQEMAPAPEPGLMRKHLEKRRALKEPTSQPRRDT